MYLLNMHTYFKIINGKIKDFKHLALLFMKITDDSHLHFV